MNAILALPMELRLAGVFLIGVVLGSAVNWAIYALAWYSRPISPWQRPHPDAPPRRWSDLLPIVGWLGLARESRLFGQGHWIRPLLLEIATGAALAALYYWEATSQLAPRLPDVVPAAEVMLHQQFFSHAVLLLLMLAATFIDFDEKTIPDEITIPGTLAGLVLSALWPNSHLPVERFIRPPLPVTGYGPLLFTSSDHWPAWLDGQRGLVAGLAIFVTWCIVLIPALCTLRRGWRKAVAYYFASLARDSAWWKLLLLAVLGSGLIAAVWSQGGERWQALFTSLVGLAFGGGLIWAVRIVGQVALQKEAMGFGDVTLMAMIGAFLGWQACLMIFFLSPFAALFIAVAQWAVTGRRDIAFGPYLCLAAAIVVVRWPAFWTSVEPLFAAGWLVPGVLAVCLLLMLGLLMLWRVLEQAMFSRADRAADRRRG